MSSLFVCYVFFSVWKGLIVKIENSELDDGQVNNNQFLCHFNKPEVLFSSHTQQQHNWTAVVLRLRNIFCFKSQKLENIYACEVEYIGFSCAPCRSASGLFEESCLTLVTRCTLSEQHKSLCHMFRRPRASFCKQRPADTTSVFCQGTEISCWTSGE